MRLLEILTERICSLLGRRELGRELCNCYSSRYRIEEKLVWLTKIFRIVITDTKWIHYRKCIKLFHCVNISSPEGPKDLSLYDPHSDYTSSYFKIKTRYRKRLFFYHYFLTFSNYFLKHHLTAYILVVYLGTSENIAISSSSPMLKWKSKNGKEGVLL